MKKGISLICTLGNRDIQFKKEYKIVEEKFNIKLTNNRDDTNYYVVDPSEFKPATKKILENYNDLKNYISIPMIGKILKKKFDNIHNIYLIATDQKNVFGYNLKDTIYEAEIIKKIISDRYGYNPDIIKIISAEFNAKDLKEWFILFKELFNDILKEGNDIIIEFSGGMNETKEAIRLASLFNDSIVAYEVINNKLKDMNSSFYEKQIIKEKVKDLIKNYNYAGALSFKEYYVDDKKILNLIEHLNYRLNFDFDNALKSYNEERLEKLDNENNTIERLKYLILELLDNMEIELRNRNYANFLARVYRLEEAMGQYFVLKWFEKTKTKISYKLSKDAPLSGFIDAKDVGVDNLNKKIENYLRYLANGIKCNKYNNYPGVRKLVNFIEENCKIINNNNTVNYKININTPLYYNLIKYLYGNYSDEIRVYEKIQKMYKKDYNNLRHTTIVAHGFEGINRDKINTMLKNNGINNNIDNYFNAIKSEFLKIAIKDNNNGKEENIFDKLNNEIVKLL